MSHSSEIQNTLPEEEATHRLVQVLLHVFAPLFCKLASALRSASPVTIDLPDSSTSLVELPDVTHSLNEGDAVAPLTSASSSPQRTTTTPFGSGPSRTEAEASVLSWAASPPSSREATMIFLAPGSPTAELQRSADADSADASPSLPHAAERSDDPFSLPTSTAQQPVKGHYGRPRLVLVAAPLPPVTSNITQARDGDRATTGTTTEADGKSTQSCTALLTTLPNAVLWEAVAALAESVLLDGACYCWLRATAMREGRDGNDSESGSGTSRTATAIPSGWKGNGSTMSAHLLLATVLLHFDTYALDELRSYNAADDRDRTGCATRTQRRLVLGEEHAYVRPSVLFPALAAALVRSVALHTAHLLDPLMATELEASTQEDSGADPLTTLRFPSCDTTHASAEALPFVLRGSDAVGPAVTFRTVQEELKQQQRHLQRTRQALTDAAVAAKRPRTSTRKDDNAAWTQTDAVASPTHTTPRPPPLRSRMREAASMDESAFVWLHKQRDPSSPRRAVRTDSAKPQRGDDVLDRQNCNDVRCLVNAGASVLCEVPGSAVLAVSCVLPEVFQRGEATSSATRSSDGAAKDLSRSEAHQGDAQLAFGVLSRWCAGLQQIATLTPENGATNGVLSCFTLSAAHLYHYLRDHTVNPQVEHTTRYALDRGRSVLPPSQSPVTSTEARVRTEERGADTPLEAEDGEGWRQHSLPWSTAHWSIRAFVGPGSLAELQQQQLEDEDKMGSTAAESSSSLAQSDNAPHHAEERTATATVKRMRLETHVPSPACNGGLPIVRWVPLCPSTTEGTPNLDSPVPVWEAAQRSTAALFADFVSPVDASASPGRPNATAAVADTLGEVGTVLACVEAACASRTLVDASSWRYGRNRIHVAATSFVTVETDTTGGTSPTHPQHDFSVALTGSEAQGTHDERPGETDAVPTAAVENRSTTVGLYHHESGLLYVSGGATYAMETE